MILKIKISINAYAFEQCVCKIHYQSALKKTMKNSYEFNSKLKATLNILK